jgi:hypothetical protein
LISCLQVDGSKTPEQIASLRTAYVESAALANATEPLLPGWTSSTSFYFFFLAPLSLLSRTLLIRSPSFHPLLRPLPRYRLHVLLHSLSLPSSEGCYTEGTSGRALQGYSTSNTTSMTPNLCISICAGKGFSFAATEWAQECFCGSELMAGSTNAGSPVCAHKCTGNKNSICGGE